MTTKFVFPFKKDEVASVTGGYNISPAGGGGTNGIPSLIELSNISKCSINAYSLLGTNNIVSTRFDRDAVVGKIPTAAWGCNNGANTDAIAGKVFFDSPSACSQGFFCNHLHGGSSYSAVPKSDGKANYCEIAIYMSPNKNCLGLDFGNKNISFGDKSDNKINSAVPTFETIKIMCSNGSSEIDYQITNSTASLNLSDPDNPRLEFIPLDNANLGCQYHDGDNYLAFLCNATNDSVDAVQYKCGL